LHIQLQTAMQRRITLGLCLLALAMGMPLAFAANCNSE
jgi:hypothetical protein